MYEYIHAHTHTHTHTHMYIFIFDVPEVTPNNALMTPNQKRPTKLSKETCS